ncbi:MAG TPA: HAMP domain-containing sensor histidine kinase [Polyangiaceae bacterium]|nr:HAMP domain-containing sensor histidine kinase [Polyangiaceae bacterium]
MKRLARAGLWFKLFWVGLAQLVVVLVSIVAISMLVARRAARWDVPNVMSRVEPVAERPAELKALLTELRAAGGPAISIYDAGRALVASNVEPPLALPALRFEPPRPGERPPRPPPGVFDGVRHALLGHPPPHGPERVAALRLVLPNGPGTLVLEPPERFLGAWLLVLSILTSVSAVGFGAYLTARLVVLPLLHVERELVANVAHELRTPLSRIRVALDIAAEGNAATARASLADIGLDLAELEVLIDDVLTAARLELAGAAPARSLNLQRVASATLVDESVARFRIRHPEHRLDVTRDDVLPSLDADPVLLRRALDNLLENAAKYSPDTTEPIVLAVERRDGRVRFEVRDRGIGIAQRDLERVFSPFFRAERSRARSAGGVGLGLTLARQVVEAHGGKIRLESAPGEGTRARIELPVGDG